MSAYSSAYQASPGGWSWPDDVKPETSKPEEDIPITPSANEETTHTYTENATNESRRSPPRSTRSKRWRPRQCRICLDTVYPTFSQPIEHLPAFLQTEPTAIYESVEGRLIRPCKCKGSSRYVHESCLQEWRHADPSYGRRFYYECPTCHFQYRLERMEWGRWIKSRAAQVGLTILIFFSAIFVLGFIADPIIDLYLDPWNSLASAIPFAGHDDYEELHIPIVEDFASGWIEHFLKGFTSLGLVGSIKIFFTMRPWDWFNLRNSGVLNGGGGRRGGAQTGRDRINNFTWLLVITGVLTFIYTVWKLVRSWSRRMLEKAGERVMDVQGDDPEKDDEDDDDDDADQTHANTDDTSNSRTKDDTAQENGT